MMKCDLTQQLRKLFGRNSSKRWQRFLASITGLGMAGAGSYAQADTSTTLTGLPGFAPPNNNQLVPVNHGSNAEVALTWSPEWQQYGVTEYAGGWNTRGNVYQMEGDTQSIAFAPTAANVKVTVNSFFLDEWAGGGNTYADWSVTGSVSGLLASGTWSDKNTANDPGDGGGRTQISPNAAGAAGETLTLLFTDLAPPVGGFDSYLAMDNLVFSSTIIPEPATAVMGWLGVGALGARAMRRKR
jgi:hypothetical protein